MKGSQPRPRLLIASGVRGDTRRYRTFHLVEQSLLAGLDARLSHIMEPEFTRDATRADLLILHRAPLDRNVETAMRAVRRNGGRVLFDTDDFLFDPSAFQWIDSPDFRDPLRASLYLEDMRRLRQSMEGCDAILASTSYLASQAAKLGLPVHVHRNGFSMEMLEISGRIKPRLAERRSRIVIGYASGTPTHDRDFASIAQPLREVLDRHAEIDLWVIGPLTLDVGWKSYLRTRVLRLPHVPWKILPGYLSRFDLNLAPLVRDNPFARSKSEIKWMEAALVKVPTLATPGDAFRESIHPGRDGFLADTSSEWESNLELLIGDPQLARKVGASAFSRVMDEYHPLNRAQGLIKIIHNVMPGVDIDIPEQREIDPDRLVKADPSLFRMAAYSLRTRGPGILVRQVIIYLRRAISPLFPYRAKKHSGGGR